MSLTFADNPDALTDSRFDKLSDFSWILLFSEHLESFSMAQVKERLRNPVLQRHLDLCMQKEGEEAQKAEFLRYFYFYYSLNNKYYFNSKNLVFLDL